MKTIYLNIKEPEESRIIVVQGGSLISYEQEYQGEESKKGNVYKGVVTNVEPSLEAVFVDLGEDKNGLLPLREIPENAAGVSPGGVQVGDQLLVQIKKDNVGDKGSGLTGYISLAGHFLILKPYREGASGITANASSNSRRDITQMISELPIPENMSVIVRSMAIGHGKEDIIWDLECYLLRLWEAIKSSEKSITQPTLIYRENDLVLHTLRDYFRPDDGDKIVCDDHEKYQELRAFIELLFPDNVEQIYYHDSMRSMVPPAVEQKIEQIYMREVAADNGVRVVFDSTEALVAIDVNSGRQREGGDIEETALKTNLKAAEIICKQLRLRNLGGLIVIDFIDMKKHENREALEQRVAELIRKDYSRTRMGKISEFGLMELSRQRTSRSLLHSQAKSCPRCDGTGHIWREQTFAMHLLRRINGIAFQSNTSSLVAQVPRETGIFLLNEKREELQTIENDSGCNIIIMPDDNLLPPQCKLKSVKGDKKQALEAAAQVIQQENAEQYSYKPQSSVPVNNPVLRNMLPQETMPSKKVGRFKKLLGSILGNFSTASANAKKSAQPSGSQKNRQQERQKGAAKQKKRTNAPATNAPAKQRNRGKRPQEQKTAPNNAGKPQRSADRNRSLQQQKPAKPVAEKKPETNPRPQPAAPAKESAPSFNDKVAQKVSAPEAAAVKKQSVADRTQANTAGTDGNNASAPPKTDGRQTAVDTVTLPPITRKQQPAAAPERTPPSHDDSPGRGAKGGENKSPASDWVVPMGNQQPKE